MRRLKALFLSWDFGISILITAITFYHIPNYIDMKFTLSFYNVLMTVLSIIFSLFFTAMTIIMSSSDNDYIEFLERENIFSELLWSFKFTLLTLFISLLISILLYSGTSYWLSTYSSFEWLQNKILLLIIEFMFLYGMFATWLCILDTIRFSKFRIKFLKKKRKEEEEENKKSNSSGVILK